MHQTRFFLQQEHLEQIAHAFGVADDAVANGVGTELLSTRARRIKNRQLTQGMGTVRSVRHAQRAGVVELAQQEFALVALAQRAVARMHTGQGQQLGHNGFVLVGALAQVHGGQVKAEHLNRSDERAQARGGQCFAVVSAQRRFDGAQIGQTTFGTGVRILWCDGVARGLATGQLGERGGQSGVHAR